jgi:circadian clock protein KaiC
MFRPPVDLYLDEWVYDLLGPRRATGAQRVAIDSLGDLRLQPAATSIRFREYMYSLLQRCARRNVSVIMTQEVPELFGITRLSEFGISHVSDNVVLLQFLRGDSEVKRAMTVLKTRGSAHDPRDPTVRNHLGGALAWRPVPSRPEPSLAVQALDRK